MHIKFLARGTGSARAAADYLLGARDATGQLREGVEILQGDPHQVAAVADALAFEHKYTSGVIAWAPDDTPTDAQIGAVIDAFEQTAWAGLEPDRYAWAAVLVEQWRREYNTVRPHSACGGFPPAPEAIKPSPWFLRMPVLHGPPQLLGLT